MAAVNFPDSPSNGDTQDVGGVTYTYNSSKGYWTAAAGGGGGGASVTTDDSAPSSPSDGDLWYDTDDGGMFVYYEDTDSSQWVEVIGSQGAAGAAGATGAAGSTSVYATVDALPLTGNTQGDMAHVTANNTLYFWNGSGWYKIALINTNPSISGVSSSYDLAIDGTATTVTMTATDPEGLPITYSIASDTSGNIATVSQGTGSNTNVFTITPSTNTAYAGSFTLTFRASDGVNIATAPATFTLQFQITNSKYTTALITTSGSAGGNTTFTDSSSNSHTVTANGDATQNSFSPYRHGGYSTYFDGSGDYLTAPISSAIGTGDFTLEAWVWKDSQGATQVIAGTRTTSSDSTGFSFVVNSSNELGFYTSTYNAQSSSLNFPSKTWVHVAAVRSGTNLTLYKDGVSVATGTSSHNFSKNVLYTGQNVSTQYWTGYMTDVRLVVGSAVYTSNFTAPTERLTAITNTSLLICHLPYFKDGSTNNQSVTTYGNTNTQPVAPYDRQRYSVGNNGGSVYLDGTGDYLDVTSSAANLGTGDFTVECWAYWSADPRSIIYDTRQSDGNSGHAIFMTSTTHNVVFYDNNATVLTSAGAVKQGIWNHIAVVRNSGTINIFINGKKDTAQVTGNTTDFDAHAFRIGEKTYGGIPNVTGNITDFRISSTARYTTDFTPPIAPLASDGDTSLLLNMQGAKIFDKAQVTDNLLIRGNAAASTAAYKYLPTSIYLDGTGDLVILEHMDEAFAGDFTVEGWYKFNTFNTSTGANTRLFCSRTGNANYASSLQILVAKAGDSGSAGAGTISVYTNAYQITGSATQVSDNSWHHIAVTREGTSLKLFVDGTHTGNTKTTSQSFQFLNPRLGARDDTTDTSSKYTGYMSDVRITKGLARYTANFTPPAAALQG